MIGGTDQTSTGRDRYQGYVTAMERAGLNALPYWRIPGPRTKQGGFEAAGQFLALKDHPTAAVCWNDLVAIGLMNGIARAGHLFPASIFPSPAMTILKRRQSPRRRSPRFGTANARSAAALPAHCSTSSWLSCEGLAGADKA